MATPESTTTSLTLPTLTYGAEGSPAAFTGTVAGPSASDGIPAGTVTVYYDYGVAGQTQLCQATLSGGSGDSVNYSCSLASATQLPAGAYTNVVASYSGGSSSNTSFTYNASTSSPQGLTVSPEAENTTTSLTLPTLTYGSEGSPAAFTGTVAGPSSADGIPAGTVTVYYDYGVAGQTQLCQATLSGGSGDSVNYSCSLASATQLPAGAYTNVVAAYSGGSSSNTSFTYNASTSSPQGLTVSPASATPESTTTSLTLPTLTYGAEGSPAAFTGTVAGPSAPDGIPAGTVTVYDDYGVAGQTQLCQATLSGGSGDSVNYSCSLERHAAAGGRLHQRGRLLQRRVVVEHQLHLQRLDLEPPGPHGEPGLGHPREHHHVAHAAHPHLWRRGFARGLHRHGGRPDAPGRDPRRDGHRLLRLRGRRADPAVPSDLERWQR